MTKKIYILSLMAGVLCMVAAAFAATSHKDFAQMKIKDCNECHQSQGAALNHGEFWVKEHRLAAANQQNNCKDCHEQSFCLDCHKGGGIDSSLHSSTTGPDYMPRSHKSDFRELHPIKAKEDPRSCNRCHDAKNFCAACHNRFPKGTLDIKSHQMLGPNGQKYGFAVGEHSREARRNLQSCQACHPDGDVCIQCHSSGKVSPHPRGWNKVSGRLKSAGGNRTCVKCHIPGTY